MAGLIVSLGCLLYLFAGAVRSAQPGSGDIMRVDGPTTAVSRSSQIVTLAFAVLNVPPTLVLLALESFMPSRIAPLTREVVAYSIGMLAVIGWWWLLAMLVNRRAEKK